MKHFILLLASQNHNQALATTVLDQLTQEGASGEIVDLVSLNLPLYSTKQQDEHGVPDHMASLFETCKNSNGFIIVAPEYNGGIPPVLTNAIAWLSVAGKEWREAFNGKVAGIASFSGGGGSHLVTGLRIQLAYIGLTVIGRSLQTSFKQALNQDSLVDFVTQLIARA